MVLKLTKVIAWYMMKIRYGLAYQVKPTDKWNTYVNKYERTAVN
jgi:hypothetical protein